MKARKRSNRNGSRHLRKMQIVFHVLMVVLAVGFVSLNAVVSGPARRVCGLLAAVSVLIWLVEALVFNLSHGAGKTVIVTDERSGRRTLLAQGEEPDEWTVLAETRPLERTSPVSNESCPLADGSRNSGTNGPSSTSGPVDHKRKGTSQR